MTDSTMLVQARVSAADARQLDADAETLGLTNRSEALRAGLRLLHRQAEYAALGREYDIFYGPDGIAPISEITAAGHEIAAAAMARPRPRA